jgi:hypothetical protein
MGTAIHLNQHLSLIGAAKAITLYCGAAAIAKLLSTPSQVVPL